MGREAGREVAALAREVARQSQAPTRPRFTLVMFTLHVHRETWETFVSPDEVAELTGLHRSTVYRHVELLQALGELVPRGRRGPSVLRRVLPDLEVSHQVRQDESHPSRTSVAFPFVSRQVRHEGEEEVGKTPQTPPLLDRFAISRGGRGKDQGKVEGGGDATEASASWSRLVEHVRGELSEYAFHVWIDPLVPVALEAGVLRVWAPRPIHAMVRDRYRPALTAAARTELGDDVTVEVVADPREPDATAPKRTNRRRRQPRAGA